MMEAERMPNNPPPTPGLAAPGWYPDNHQPHTVRYWDGRAWTQQTAPAMPQHGYPAPANQWAAQAADANLVTAGQITGIFIPVIGFIIGIVLVLRGNSKGAWIMAGSFGAAIVWYNILAGNF